MESFLRDLRHAARALLKRPLFTAVASTSLAVGLGANTTIFGAVEALLLRPRPGIPNYDRVVELGRGNRGSGFDTFSYPDFLDIREQVPALADVAAYRMAAASLSRDGSGERVSGMLVTPSYFQVLGSTSTPWRWSPIASGWTGWEPTPTSWARRSA